MSLSARLLSVPSWLLLPGIVMLSVGVAIGGLLLFHRRVDLPVRQRHNEVAGFVYAVLGVPYGVLVGFAILVVWEQYNTAQTNMEHEVSAVRAVFREISVYPKPAEVVPLDGSLKEYVRFIIDDEFPAMAHMEASPRTQAVSAKVWIAAKRIQPQTPAETVVYQQILEHLDEFGQYRALRLLAARDEIPGSVWLALLTGAVLTVVFSYLFGCINPWAHFLMTGTLALLNGIAIYVVLNLDHPFAGETRLYPEGFEQALVDFAPSPSPVVLMPSR